MQVMIPEASDTARGTRPPTRVNALGDLPHSLSIQMNKREAHDKIGEAAVAAKCWMHGIAAYPTAGLAANFKGSDLIIGSGDLKRLRLIQVKAGYSSQKGRVYFTQCKGEQDLTGDKFLSDFVVLVNLDAAVAKKHEYDGSLDFSHLSFYVLPREHANTMYRVAVRAEAVRPLVRKKGTRKLGNASIYLTEEQARPYRNAWHLLIVSSEAEGRG